MLSNTLLSRLTPYAKDTVGIISVDYEATGLSNTEKK
jgi:hypothetical protein